MIYVDDPDFTLHVGDVRDVLATMPDESVDCCVTSPPYWGLRDYGVDGQIGLERTLGDYIGELVAVFADVRRVLKPAGTVWLNLGDAYAAKTRGSDKGWEKSRLRNPGYVQKAQAASLVTPGGDRHRGKRDGFKDKDLMLIPHRVAIALQDDGWWVRADVIWDKPNSMPESTTDRPTKSHEHVFLLAKSHRYYYNEEAVREPLAPSTMPRIGRNTFVKRSDVPHRIAVPKIRRSGNKKRVLPGDRDGQLGNGNRGANVPWEDDGEGRNLRSVWRIPTKGYRGAHFAVFPEQLVEKCILAGCPPHGVVFDPFLGSGTTALVARDLGRRSVGIELKPDYARMAAERLSDLRLLLPEAV